MCDTTTDRTTHISTECATGGSAQCDGYCVEHGVECICSCHGAWDLPFTVSAVRDWHDEMNNVVASFEHRSTLSNFPNGVTDHQTAALVAHRHGTFHGYDSAKSYVVVNGQDRTVIAERY
jgi:hypothetical protein